MKNTEDVKNRLAFLMKYVEGALEANPSSHANNSFKNIHFEITNILNILVYGKELEQPKVKK